MTPERWKQIEELYHEAHALPDAERSAFLLATCSDSTLRAEVESLLNESGGSFLDTPALALNPPPGMAAVPGAMAGRVLGDYQLNELLGAGGMGEVYRARDLKLERDVAIKILPPAFTTDRDRLARFEREARMLAALNHPNICAIYGTADANGIRLLVLELVEGPTLADRLADTSRQGSRGAAIPLGEALSIARQVAEALEVAHEKGIVHRDLKPANVKVTSGGLVKVLDFGLAKAVGDSSSIRDLTNAPGATHDGRIGIVMGTAAYMSPEQARGLGVDKRTDIWAFGCVLYEMLTGRAAFHGATVSDTIVTILEREPDWSALPAGTPPAVQRVLVRCLTKDPKRRIRDIGDARLEIDSLSEVRPGTSEPSAPVPRSSGRVPTWLPWIAFVALAAGIGVWEASRTIPQDNPLASVRFRPITDWVGTEGPADISPDGRFVAFVADREGPFELWWTQVGTGRFTRLTTDGLIRPNDVLRVFGFSGDGSEIWRTWNPSRPYALGPNVLIPLTGGTPRPILGEKVISLSWSPDGERVVYMKRETDDAIFVADRTGGDAREVVAAEPHVHNHNPVWAADGQWIYFVRGIEPTDAMDTMDVWRVRPSGGTPGRVTEQSSAVNFLAALDPRTLLYIGRADDMSGPWLWALDVANKGSRPRRFTVGLEQYTSVAVSRDGRRIVATVANPTSGLWRVPLRESGADEREAEPYPLPTSRAIGPRFGGTSLFYLASIGASGELWRFEDGQPFPVRSGVDGALVDMPAVTRDGRHVAAILRKARRRYLTVMSSDGSESRTLAGSLNIRGTADWSPDGRWIAVGVGYGDPQHEQGLFKIPVDGGAPVPLVGSPAFNPVWSPDGRLIVYVGEMSGSVSLRGVRPDGVSVEMPPAQVAPGSYRFLPNGKGLVYLPNLLSQDFWLLDLEARATRQLTRLGNRGMLRTFDITPDGKYIVFDRSQENSNIVLIELPAKDAR